VNLVNASSTLEALVISRFRSTALARLTVSASLNAWQRARDDWPTFLEVCARDDWPTFLEVCARDDWPTFLEVCARDDWPTFLEVWFQMQCGASTMHRQLQERGRVSVTVTVKLLHVRIRETHAAWCETLAAWCETLAAWCERTHTRGRR
jgi:hypothetical protein